MRFAPGTTNANFETVAVPESKQTVLVTGSLGYIGCRLVERLLASGHTVIGVDIDYYHDATHGELPLGVSQLTHIRRDIREMQQSDFDGVDVVMHLAALSNDPLGNLDPALTHEINHLASVRLARLARSAGVGRFLFSPFPLVRILLIDCLAVR